jgi:ABC-type multidrug transport system fused ATPase/permease subunit
VAAHDENLSQGQRQLVSLARVPLRRSSVMIKDEVTASVHLETTSRVQGAVKRELQAKGDDSG